MKLTVDKCYMQTPTRLRIKLSEKQKMHIESALGGILLVGMTYGLMWIWVFIEGRP